MAATSAADNLAGMRLPIIIFLMLIGRWSVPAAEVAIQGLPAPVPLITDLLGNYPKLKPQPSGMPFKKAIRAKITETVDEAWKIRIIADLPNAIRKGDLLVVDFWARGETSDARLEVSFSQRKAPFVMSRKSFRLGNTWEHIMVADNAAAGYGENELRVSVNLGFGKQILCLSEINAVSYGQAAIKADELVARLKTVDQK